MYSQAVIRHLSRDEVKALTRKLPGAQLVEQLDADNQIQLADLDNPNDAKDGAFLLRGAGVEGCAFVSTVAAYDAERAGKIQRERAKTAAPGGMDDDDENGDDEAEDGDEGEEERS